MTILHGGGQVDYVLVTSNALAHPLRCDDPSPHQLLCIIECPLYKINHMALLHAHLTTQQSPSPAAKAHTVLYRAHERFLCPSPPTALSNCHSGPLPPLSAVSIL